MHRNKTITTSVAEKLFDGLYEFLLVFDNTNNYIDMYFLIVNFFIGIFGGRRLFLNLFMSKALALLCI